MADELCMSFRPDAAPMRIVEAAFGSSLCDMEQSLALAAKDRDDADDDRRAAARDPEPPRRSMHAVDTAVWLDRVSQALPRVMGPSDDERARRAFARVALPLVSCRFEPLVRAARADADEARVSLRRIIEASDPDRASELARARDEALTNVQLWRDAGGAAAGRPLHPALLAERAGVHGGRPLRLGCSAPPARIRDVVPARARAAASASPAGGRHRGVHGAAGSGTPGRAEGGPPHGRARVTACGTRARVA